MAYCSFCGATLHPGSTCSCKPAMQLARKNKANKTFKIIGLSMAAIIGSTAYYFVGKGIRSSEDARLEGLRIEAKKKRDTQEAIAKFKALPSAEQRRLPGVEPTGELLVLGQKYDCDSYLYAMVQTAAKDPDSIKDFKTYRPSITTHKGESCYKIQFSYYGKNSFSAYVPGRGTLWLKNNELIDARLGD